MSYTNTNIDLDQYETLNLNQETPTSSMHIMPINSEIKAMDTTPSVGTSESLYQRACDLPNVEDKLNSKCNNTPSKPTAYFFE